MGYVPERKFGKYLSRDFVVWDPVRRNLTAQALAEPDGKLPDILCLQEVENMDALRKLNLDHLAGHYQYQLLIDGRDPRNIDVAVLSVFPIVDIRSNLDVLDDDGTPLMSRDCLEVTITLPSAEDLTLFVNHLKSKFVDARGLTTAELKAKRWKATSSESARQHMWQSVCSTNLPASTTQPSTPYWAISMIQSRARGLRRSLS